MFPLLIINYIRSMKERFWLVLDSVLKIVQFHFILVFENKDLNRFNTHKDGKDHVAFWQKNGKKSHMCSGMMVKKILIGSS